MKVIDSENHFARVAWLDALRNSKTRCPRMAEDPDGKGQAVLDGGHLGL